GAGGGARGGGGRGGGGGRRRWGARGGCLRWGSRHRLRRRSCKRFQRSQGWVRRVWRRPANGLCRRPCHDLGPTLRAGVFRISRQLLPRSRGCRYHVPRWPSSGVRRASVLSRSTSVCAPVFLWVWLGPRRLGLAAPILGRRLLARRLLASCLLLVWISLVPRRSARGVRDVLVERRS